MKLTKCENGHFYDGDKFPACPYCDPALQGESGIVQAGTAAQAATPAAAEGPVAGWLMAVAGPGRGRDLRIGEGRNYLGLSDEGAPQTLSADAPLSVRIAIVSYDPKDVSFTLLPGSASELCYRNGAQLLTPQPLAAGDTVAFGKVKMQFVPFCGGFLPRGWHDGQ